MLPALALVLVSIAIGDLVTAALPVPIPGSVLGLIGAVAGPGLLNAAGVRDERAAGFALGLASHAIGAARAFQTSETVGAFAKRGDDPERAAHDAAGASAAGAAPAMRRT